MKKIKTIFVCSIIAVLLCACSSRSYISTSTGVQTDEAQALTVETQEQTEETQPMEMPTQSAEVQPQQEGQSSSQDNQENDMQLPREADNLEAAQAKLAEVLAGTSTFFSHSYGKSQTIAEYCSTFGAESGITVEITKYTAVDLDQDNVPEVVLWITVNEYSDYGTVVLRYQNGEVEEYTFAYRQMFDLKQDGTFSCSGSEFDGIASLTFHEGDWNYKEITGQQQDAKESVEWFDYPSEDYSELFNR